MDLTNLIFYATMAVVALLTWAGTYFGRPALVWLANLLKQFADKDGDGKPDAPAATVTKVPGLDLCELLPRTAEVADRLAVVRSVTSPLGEHGIANATQLEVAPPTHAAFVSARSAGPRKVALPWLLMVLTMLSPVLQQLVAKALDALAARLGREPTAEEAVQAAWQVHDEWVATEKRQHPVAVEPVGDD